MPSSSGYSIQRNEIINISHRQQVEYHTGGGSTKVFPLRSKIDYADKSWNWEIKVGEVRYSVDRKQGVNSIAVGSPLDITVWEDGTYREGSTAAGLGSIEFDRSAGIFGSLIFAEEYAPVAGDTIEIRYQEAQDSWTGTDGGLLYQLAKDLTVHPYDTPELLKVTFANAIDLSGAPVNTGYQDPATTALRHTLTATYNDDYTTTAVEGVQKTFAGSYKVIREWRTSYEKNISSVTSADVILTSTSTGEYIPFTRGDLGDGEFRVSINGKLLAESMFTVESVDSTRRTTITLHTGSELTWMTPSDLATAQIAIGFHWKHSLDTPYGALVGKLGLGPTQTAINGTDYRFKEADGMVFTPTTSSIPNALLDLEITNAVFDINGVTLDSEAHFVTAGDIFLIEYAEADIYAPAFNLIYPKPLSNNKVDVEYALKNISDKFLVESSKGVDLLSDDSLTPEYSAPTSNRRPQKWRIRFEWDRKLASVRVNVATSYQLLDDMSVTKGQSRDGIKGPVTREPGELCDIYKEPNVGRGSTYQLIKSKSDFYRRTQKTVDESSRTYPLSYRISVTDHGMGFFMWEQASVDQDDDYSWFVVQRHVDQTTGQPEFTGKSPVHCVYSPCKRPVDIANLNQYYAASDINDLTKTPNMFTSLGQVLETEGPTLYFDTSESLFNGAVNAIDFTGKGYLEGTSAGATDTGKKDELDVGIVGSKYTATDDYWTKGIQWAMANPNTYSAGTTVFDTSFVPDYKTTRVMDLEILGFSELPRDGTNSIAKTNVSSWLNDTRLAPHFSGNVVYPEVRIPRISEFATAAAPADPPTGDETIPDSTTGANANNWSDPSYAMLDILYNENQANQEKVLDSLIVAVDGQELIRDTDAYILNYDQWIRQGDPSTGDRFIQSLDAVGVTRLGPSFRLPSVNQNDLPDYIKEIFDATTQWSDSARTTAMKTGVDLDFSVYDPLIALASGQRIECVKINPTTKEPYGIHFVHALWMIYGVKYKTPGQPTTGLTTSSYTSVTSGLLNGKLPGDPVFTLLDATKNVYIYDFFNQTLLFRDSPRPSAALTVKLINYVFADPAGNAYYIETPADRDFPERNQNTQKTINRFIVREQDVLKPWDFHVSATMHEIDSNAIINPQEQLSITQDRDFVFSFPTQLTSQRFYYPRSELDLITVSSADFSTQSGSIEIEKYSDSDGLNAQFSISGQGFDVTSAGTTHPYAGHIGPDGQQYYWKKNKRRYEGMMSTLPSGNGMRIFLQTAGSSIKFTDTNEGGAPA
jgi:hypothetical protein